MKKILLILTLVFSLGTVTSAQSSDRPEPRVIEVTGSAETLVTPNEFTFKITLRERLENKQKVTIDQQETRLKQELAKIGIDVTKDLTVFDIRSNYVPVRKRVKDVLGAKDFRLKVYEMEKIDRLQELADNLNVDNLDLIESTHTDLTRLRQETKMEAVKAAKTKANYMLGAIGERAGRSVFIREIAEERSSDYRSNFASNTLSATSYVRPISEGDASSDTLTFTQIKLRYEVLAKFEIQ